MKLFSSTTYYYFVVMISIVAVSIIITTVHAQQQQQQQQTPSLPDGLYCGTTTKTQGLTTLMQIHGNLLSVLFTTYPGGDPRPPPRQCEMQFLLSHQYNTVSNPTLQNPNTVRWNLTKVLSEDSDSSSSSSSVDSCAGMDITSPVLSFAPNVERQNALTLFFQVNGESGLTIEVSQSVCSAANPISPWIPSGYYCTNLADNVGISIGPKNSFEVDLLGFRIRGKITVNTQSGRMTIMAFGTDVTELFEVSQYNSTTGLVRLEGEYEGLEIAVSGGRAFCAKPDGALNNTVNLIKSGSYCGTTQNDYIGLTLLEGHLFVLNYGGICSATGYYIESLNSQQQPQVSFFFSQYSDCVQNVSITSATSSAAPYSSLSVSFFGGNTITPQTATLNLNQCENVPFSLLRNDIVPNGLYCLAPSFADQYLPGGTLGVAIFADKNANTTTGRQRYQIWSGSCEAHGWFTVDGATGIVSLHEHVQHSSCPSSDQVEIVGAKWSAFRGALSVSVKYQSLVVTVSAKQSDCPRHTPSTVINSLPTGLYCNSSEKNFPSITVLGDMLDFAISDSCSAQGSYQVHTNGVVGVTLTALSNGCNDLFIHTLSFTAPTPLVPASFNFQGFYMNSSLNFKAVNCSHPARTNPIQMTTLCFQVADSSTAGVKHWGFALLGKSFGRFTLGACVINADFKVSKENQITDYAISSSTNECNGLKMQLVKFATDGSDAATISITSSNNNQINQQVTASRQCPTTLTTTTTTSTTTLPPTTATSTSTTTSTTVILPSTTTTTKQQQQSSSSTTAAMIGTSTTSSAPTTTTTTTTNPPPTTSTLPPTLPVGTYNFKTSNSFSGSLTVSPTQVVLAIGDCSEDGKLVAQTQDQNKYDFVPETQSSACSTTTKVSDVTFTQKKSSSSSSSSSDNEISVTATINGQAYSAAAVQQDSNNNNNNNNNSPSDSSDGGGSSTGPAVGGAIGGLLVLGLIGFLYMRKKNSSGSTGQGDNDGGPRKFTQTQNRNAVNEEMLASAVSNYQNFDERFSTQGQNDNTLDI